MLPLLHPAPYGVLLYLLMELGLALPGGGLLPGRYDAAST